MSAQLTPGAWYTLREVIDLFVAMGCSPREFPDGDVDPGGMWHTYYLYSDVTEAIVSLIGYEDGDAIAPSTIERWERALGIQIPPKPAKRH